MRAGRPRYRLSLIALSLSLAAQLLAVRPGPALAAESAGPDDPCGAEIHLAARLALDPEMAARRELLESLVREAQAKGIVPMHGEATNSNIIYTIPVAVHIVHNGGPENISYPQVLSQIAAMNRDAQNLPGNAPPATDCQIQFCLATLLPQGSTVQWANPNEPGVTRTQSTQTIVQISNDVALKAIDYLPSDKYLNVWVVRRIDNGSTQGSILGYATFPGTVQPTLDGIVMDYRVMGANGMGFGSFAGLLASNDQGKVFAHEVGHWLDLFHPFHGGCVIGDQVADTPWEANNFWGCPSGTPTTVCSNTSYPAPIHNFMDYTNDPCRWEFTPGQKVRMYAAITTYRSKLVSPGNLVATGACAPSVYAAINLGATQTCVNVPVACSTPPCNNCTYAWGGTGTFQNPSASSTTVTFATPGAHSVTLTVSDGTNNSSNVIKVYASACTPIQGTCTNWVWSTRARLSFASGMPVAVGGTVNIAPETAAQVSHASTGNLLFYTDDNKIWTAANALMPTFAGSTVLIGGPSAHNGALVVPVPGSSTRYFVFSVRQFEDGLQPDPLHYSVVDMTLNSGAGDVVSGQLNLNIPLPGTPKRLIEGMTLIPHCNGVDWWLVTHGAGEDASQTNNWTQFLYVTPITATGPGVSQSFNNGIGGAGTPYSAWGALTASRDGSKLAVVQAKARSIGIYTFNRATGVPSLLLNTGNIDANHDLAFSPNGQILYYTYVKTGTIDQFGLRQYDIASQQTRTLTTPLAPGGDLDPRLGPDDKIYVAPSLSTSLHCVNFPDQFNTLNLNECGFNPFSIPLPVGASTTFYGTLPNLLPICSASPQPASFTTQVTNCTTVKFTTPNCGPWTWNFGDNSAVSNLQNPTHTYAPGTYTVTLNVPSASLPSIQKTITVGNLPISIVGPNITCGGPLNYTAVGPSNYVYTWTITGGSPATATGNNVFVSWGLNSGSILLTATDPATGCVSTAFIGIEACQNCTPPPLDMVGWWPLDEAAGTLAQEIVAGNDGQDANAGSPAKVTGAVLNARQFDGATGVIRVPSAPKFDLGTGDLTIDAWIQTSSISPLLGIVEKRLLSPDRGFALYLKQGRLALLLGDGSAINEYWASSSTSLADGAWHHVAATENRANTLTGTSLYVDGALIATFPGYSPTATITSTERLVIGAQEPATLPTGWFAGRIDEVEIFKRALAADEIARIWGSGPAGKCKEYVRAPKGQTFCTDQPYVLASVKLCNLGTTPQSFNLSFSGGSGAGCTGPSPTQFQLVGANNPIPVPPGPSSCVTVTVKITKPSGLVNGATSCWKVSATNIATNVTHVGKGYLWANDVLCPRVTDNGGWGGTGSPATMQWTVTNTTPAFVAIPAIVMVEPAEDDEPLPPPSISLNGLPPGNPWFTNLVMAPGESTTVTVEADFLQDRPFHFYDVVLYADTDDDGDFDLASSASLFYNERPATLVDAPDAPTPTGVRVLGVRPNPLRGAARVEFEMPTLAWVRLSLFDVSGRRVRKLADGLIEAGRQTRTLEATGLPSGVYFVRLESQGVSQTRRVVLLRN